MDDYYVMADSLLNLPSSVNNPLSYQWLKDTQDADSELAQQCKVHESGFQLKQFDDIELV